MNSHRLLVRGHRVEYHGEDDGTQDKGMLRSLTDYWMLYILLAAALILLAAIVIRLVLRRKHDSAGRKKDE